MTAGAESGSIDTDAISARLRARAIDPASRRIRLTRFTGSLQEEDFAEPTNCNGLGRIRHFRRFAGEGWPSNPLPLDPALHVLGLPQQDTVRAQVFQSAVCNWRCWYCFVDFDLLKGSDEHSVWVSAEEMVDLFAGVEGRPRVLDLTGGQPDLTPEWVPWTMRALQDRGLSDTVFLWSDDNLSNDYFWRFLSDEELRTVREYRMYAKVCCFKGFDPASFTFNTRAAPALFDRQFNLMRRVLDLGIDVYAYATFTTPTLESVERKMRAFVDALQRLSWFLPLRTIPLFVQPFTPVESRLTPETLRSMENQVRAVQCWSQEILSRFSGEERALPIWAVPLAVGGGRP